MHIIRVIMYEGESPVCERWRRRLGWVVVGIAGLPAAALGVVYLYSIIVLPLAFAFGAFYNAWSWTHHYFTGLTIVVLTVLVVGLWGVASFPLEWHSEIGWGLLIGLSAVCAVACAEKLGRMVGARVGRISARA